MRYVLMIDGGWQGDEADTFAEALRLLADELDRGNNTRNVQIVDRRGYGPFEADKLPCVVEIKWSQEPSYVAWAMKAERLGF